ncbi:MAG: hypothetical protein JXD22_04290 [Sedimentisphaerales bacterium]|nr:hypothetical protein [Sedimentisphaerales bacterium]
MKQNNQPDNPAHDSVDAVKQSFDSETSPQLEQQMQQSLQNFRHDLREHPYLHRRRFFNAFGQSCHWLWNRLLLRPSLMAGTALACIIFAMIFMAGSSTPSWAEVSEKFKSMSFAYASIYVRPTPLAQPKQIELWIGQAGKIRLRCGEQVIFANKGLLTKTFDLNKRSESYPDQMIYDILNALGDAKEVSLTSIIKGISSGKLTESTPLINGDAQISKDLVVFDVEDEYSSQWIRVWALRESKLPTRISIRDPWGGPSIDVMMTYSKEQPAVFFDPDEFAKKLKNTAYTTSDLAYMFLKDPGGKSLSRY